MAREVTLESFLKDVEHHQMKVLLDQGTHRHLRFQAPNTSNQYFEIVTFPGTLVYVGDMGSFVFQRLADMFDFFRSHDGKINPSYWGEKLEAVDNRTHSPGHKAYSEDKARERIQDHVNDWCEDEALTEEQKSELQRELDAEVFYYLDQGEYEAHRVLRDFEYEIDGTKFEFHDTWEWDLREYTGRFLWCCYAIAWAINKYDEAHRAATL